MYAVIKMGGKQYNITKGDIIQVEKQDVQDGTEVSIKDVLLVCDGTQIKVGQPLVNGATVKAEILEQVKDKKKIAYKYRRRKAYHRKRGHRQQLTKLEIKEIAVN